MVVGLVAAGLARADGDDNQVAGPPIPGGMGAATKPFPNKELVPPLIDALKDSDGEVRQAAAGALLQIGAEAVGPLVEVVKDDKKDKALRANAAYLLGHLGPAAREALPALAGALKDDNAEVRRRAAFAIGSIVRGNVAGPNPPAGMGMPMMGGMTPGSTPMAGGMAGMGYPGMGRPSPSMTPRMPVPDPGILMPAKAQAQGK